MTLSERIARGPDPVTVRCEHCSGTFLPRDLATLQAAGFHRPIVQANAAGASELVSPAMARMRRAAEARGTLAHRPADGTLGDRIAADRIAR